MNDNKNKWGQIKLFNEDQLTNGNLVVVWMDFHSTNNAKNEMSYLTPLITRPDKNRSYIMSCRTT